MSILYVHNPETGDAEEVGKDANLPVEIKQDLLPPIAGTTVTRIYPIPGIGAASAYADGDAFGTSIVLRDLFRPERPSGTIMKMFLIDADDEGIQVDVPLYVAPITATADNSASAVSDIDLRKCRGVISINSFYNWGSNQFGQSTDNPLAINSEDGNLYTQLVVRGAANIAAGSEPQLGVVVVPD